MVKNLDKDLRPNKPGRWWIKFKSIEKSWDGIYYEYTDILEMKLDKDGKLKMMAEISDSPYEPPSFLFLDVVEWEIEELSKNKHRIEYCAPLEEKPPWED